VEADMVSKDELKTPYYLAGLRVEINQARCLVVMGIDITERKRAEKELCNARDKLEVRVEERTEELKRANMALESYVNKLKTINAELEEFAFVATHDLQEPLRKIHTFSDRLRKKYKDSLDEEGRDMVERVMKSAYRMSALLKSFLAYSHVRANAFQRVDLAEAAGNAVSNLEIMIEEARAEIEIGELPTVEADGAQMLHLLQNLISNSLKFRRQDAAPIIRVHGENTGTTCRIYVEDNGIGFEETYLDRIFKPMQRLNPQSAYAGTGMGLAICRKIVERHNGSITAKSTPGRGSTFIVELPISQSEGSVNSGLE